MKLCTRCDTTKPLSDFGRNAARADGVQVYCRVCMKAYRTGKQYDKLRWLEQREAESARHRVYRAANVERELVRSRIKGRRRRLEKPHLVNAANKARKAAQRAAIPGWADRAQIALIYAKAREMSAKFGTEFQVDHVVPLRGKLVCGLHTEANLQLLASDLNYEKRHWHWPDMP